VAAQRDTLADRQRAAAGNVTMQGGIMSPLDLLLARIRGEFLEIPGLRLTFSQACRLWQVDRATCERVLHMLLQENFLTCTRDGAFVAVPHPDPRQDPLESPLASGSATGSPTRPPA
jgi:hypothetical protein